MAGPSRSLGADASFETSGSSDSSASGLSKDSLIDASIDNGNADEDDDSQDQQSLMAALMAPQTPKLAASKESEPSQTPLSPFKLAHLDNSESFTSPSRTGDLSLRLAPDMSEQSILPRDDADDEAAQPRLVQARALLCRPLLSASNLQSDSSSGTDGASGVQSGYIMSATSQKGVSIPPATTTPVEGETSSQKENLPTPKAKAPTQTPSKRAATRQKESATISSGSGSAPHASSSGHSAHRPLPVPAAHTDESKGPSEGTADLSSKEGPSEEEVLILTAPPGQPRIDAQAVLRLHLSRGARSAPSRSNPRPKPLVDAESNFFSTSPPEDQDDEMKSYRRRAPTTPTTALTRHASPIPLPSEDSFTRPTAAEERERWRSENKALRMPLPIPVRRVEFESLEDERRYERSPPLGYALPRTPSPKRNRSPTAKGHSPSTKRTSRKALLDSRNASPVRNNDQDDLPKATSVSKGKVRDDRGQEDRDDDSLSSQLSQMSVSPSRKRKRGVIVPGTPSAGGSNPENTSGEIDRTTGFDFIARLPSVSDEHQSSNSNNQEQVPLVLMGTPVRPRDPSPEISYVDASSLEQPAASTPPPAPTVNPVNVLNVPMDVTPTQPSEIQDSQHPAIVANRQRFTAHTRTTTNASLEVPPEIERDVGLGPRRLDFGQSESTGSKESSAKEPDVPMTKAKELPKPRTPKKPKEAQHQGGLGLLGPPALISRTINPVGVKANPKIFPSARKAAVTSEDVFISETSPATSRRTSPVRGQTSPRRGTTSSPQRAVVSSPQALTTGPPSSPTRQVAVSSPERPLAAIVDRKGKGRAIPLGDDLPPGGPFRKRAFKEVAASGDSTQDRPMSDVASPVELPKLVTKTKIAPTSRLTRSTRRTSKSVTPPKRKVALAREKDRKKRRVNISPRRKDQDAMEEDDVEQPVSAGKRRAPSTPKRPADDETSEDEVAMEMAENPSPGSMKRKRLPVTTTSSSSGSARKKRRMSRTGVSRVLARWSDKVYYPGEVVGQSTSGLFSIRFDDGDELDVDVTKIRRLVFQVDDHVQVRGERNLKAVVIGVGQGTVIKVLIRDKRAEEHEVDCEVHQLVATEKDVEKQFNDRKLTVDDIRVPVDDKRMVDPQVSPIGHRAPRSSSASNMLGHSRVFSHIGFVTTNHPESGISDETKASLKADIKRMGGTILDDWDQAYSIKGSGRNDIKWTCKKRNVTTVILLADRATQTAKYLMALALGVPCVSSLWVTDTAAGVECNWTGYLLAAGRPEYANADVSQFLDPMWTSEPQIVQDPLQSTIIRRPWLDWVVLCVFPKRVVSTDLAHKYAQMMSAMGAASVEVVVDGDRASKAPGEYDLVIVPDPSVGRTKDEVLASGDNVRTVGWFKQCLIMGSMLPVSL